MASRGEDEGPALKGEQTVITVHVPGLLLHGALGLGDAVKRATSAVGIRPCAGCERRAATLNRWVMLAGPPPKRG